MLVLKRIWAIVSILWAATILFTGNPNPESPTFKWGEYIVFLLLPAIMGASVFYGLRFIFTGSLRRRYRHIS